MQQPSKIGISERALEQLGAEPRYPGFYSSLRRLKHTRQEEIIDLMSKSAEVTVGFLEMLIAASHKSEFVRKRHHHRGITGIQLRAIETTFRPLEDSFRLAASSYAGDAYALNITEAYIRRLLRDARVGAYIKSVHPELFLQLTADWSLPKSVTPPKRLGRRSRSAIERSGTALAARR